MSAVKSVLDEAPANHRAAFESREIQEIDNQYQDLLDGCPHKVSCPNKKDTL